MEAPPPNARPAGAGTPHLLARLQALRAIDRGILSAESPEEIARTALGHLRRLLPAPRGAVALWGPGDEATLLAVLTETPTALGPGTRLPLGPEPSTPALRRGEAVLYEDLAAHPDPSPTDRQLLAEGIRGYLRVPLVARGALVGTLALGAPLPRAFTAEHVEIAREVADQLALALEQARLYQAEQRWRQQLQAVMNLTRDIVGEQALPALLQDVVGRAVSLTGAHGGVLYLWDEATATLVPSAWLNHGAYLQEIRHARGEHLTGAVLFRSTLYDKAAVEDERAPALEAARQMAQWERGPRSGEEIWNEYPAHPGHDPRLVRWVPLTACMAAPLRVRARLLGVLTLDQIRPGHRFSGEELRLLETLAAQAAIVIENARLYEERRLAALQLEATVEARTRELAAANQQLAEASRRKSEFLAAMSHELRTPLNAVIGFAELLRERGDTVPPEKRSRYLEHIYRSGKHLLQLISDILDLSKVEAGKLTLQPEPVPVPIVLEDILVIARGLATKKGQTITAEIAPSLPPLHADPVRFKQILFNLLSNAVKFTPEGGTILVTARKLESEQARTLHGLPASQPSSLPAGEFLEVAVRDTGVGIRPEDLPRLFQEFSQLETTQAQKHEGTGLGLALTKRLVELHGGKIWAESEGLGKGSRFTVLLPFHGPEETARAPEENRIS